MPAPADISAVTVTLKLPAFWPSDPEIWFAQVEAQFACRRVTAQRSKFDHVISSLAPEYAAEVRDLVLRPPGERPYDVLKEQLIRRTAASEQRRLQQLFTSEELGDRKPTQLLRRMQQLIGDRPGIADSSFLRELFLQRLPPNVRMVLASTPETPSLDKLAELADKVLEVASPSVSAVGLSPEVSTEIAQLRTEVSRLQKLVNSLDRRSRSSRSASSSSRHGSSSSHHSPTPTPAVDSPAPSLCWYHAKYGEQARKCRPPCDHQLNNQTLQHMANALSHLTSAFVVFSDGCLSSLT